MSTFDCTFDQFKRCAKEFRDSAPTLDIDQLDNAWKCLGLMYLGMREAMWQHSAAIVLKIETRTFLEREHQLLSEATP